MVSEACNSLQNIQSIFDSGIHGKELDHDSKFSWMGVYESQKDELDLAIDIQWCVWH